MAKTNLGIPKLHTDKKVDDVAYYGEQVCYRYYVKDRKKDVIVRMNQYSGLTSYVMHFNTIPNTFEEAQYKRIGEASSSLILSSR